MLREQGGHKGEREEAVRRAEECKQFRVVESLSLL